MPPCLPRAVALLMLGCCLGAPAAIADDTPSPATAPSGNVKLCELTVKAGGRDRANTPVLAPVQVPAAWAKATAATLTDAAGHEIPGQLTALGLIRAPFEAIKDGKVARELHFVLPALRKGETARLTVRIAPNAAAAQGFAWHDKPDEYCELSFAGRPVLRYECKPFRMADAEETCKVFHHLYDPAGTRLLTKGPGGTYTQHRGIFFGYRHVIFDNIRCDTWACRDACQSHDRFLSEEGGRVLGRHLAEIEWRRQGKEPFAKELREVTAYNVPGGRLIEFASRLATTGTKVGLEGDPQHAGFQFRAAQEVAEKTAAQTYFLRPDGKGQPGETRNWVKKGDAFVNLPWDAMCFVLDGKRYTVVYLDNPGNPKEARYCERSYGRFGSYFEYELNQGKDLQVDYRLWLQEGEMAVAQAAALSADFVEPVEVTVDAVVATHAQP